MNPQKSPKKSTLRHAAALTGVAFEMGIIIYLAVQGGTWLDTQYPNEHRIFTLIATLLGVVVSIWVVLQQLKRITY